MPTISILAVKINHIHTLFNFHLIYNIDGSRGDVALGPRLRRYRHVYHRSNILCKSKITEIKRFLTSYSVVTC
jgi:hypothetical protein